MQAKAIARILAEKVSLPSEQAMLADISAFYSRLAFLGQPIRYAHNQGDVMPAELDQWAYNDSLADWAGIEKAPQWRRDLHTLLQNVIFDRPETFRDCWTDREKAAFQTAEKACLAMLQKHIPEKKFESINGLVKQESASTTI